MKQQLANTAWFITRVTSAATKFALSKPSLWRFSSPQSRKFRDRLACSLATPTPPLIRERRKLGGRLSPNPSDHRSGGRGWGPHRGGPTAATLPEEESRGAPVKVGTTPSPERGSSHLPPCREGSLALCTHSQQEGERGEGLALPSSSQRSLLSQPTPARRRSQREREKEKETDMRR